MSIIKYYTLDNKLLEPIRGLDTHPRNFTGIMDIDGSKFWFLNGKQHRIDGPATECTTGHRVWYLYGKKLTKKNHKFLVDIMKLKKLI